MNAESEGIAVTLTFVCPKTGQPLRTGIQADPRIMSSTRHIRLYVRCDCYGDEHKFSVKEAQPRAA
jgi:RNase P subunit RPR2